MCGDMWMKIVFSWKNTQDNFHVIASHTMDEEEEKYPPRVEDQAPIDGWKKWAEEHPFQGQDDVSD